MEAKKTTARVFEAEEPLHVRKRLRSPVKFQPPLMPLIDVMFTLMLFFLLATTLRQQEGLIASTLPDKGGMQDKGEAVPTIDIPIVVRSLGGGGARYMFPNTQDHLYFDDVPGAGGADANGPANGVFRTLEAIREQLKLTPDTATIVICPDQFVSWEHVVDVYNQAVRAKFKKIGFAPQ